MHINYLQNAIIERRNRLGIDQQTLADMAEISVRALSNIETGKGNPTLASLNAVLEVLGLELSLRVRQPNATLHSTETDPESPPRNGESG